MDKEFLVWHLIKRDLHGNKNRPFFEENQVWITFVGVNIGDEQDGGIDFLRPVLVVKKFNNHLFWGIALTKTSRIGEYYFSFKLKSDQQDSVAILSQLRIYDAKRLANCIGAIPPETMETVKRKIRQFLA